MKFSLGILHPMHGACFGLYCMCLLTLIGWGDIISFSELLWQKC